MRSLIKARLTDTVGTGRHISVDFVPLVYSLSAPAWFFSSQTWQAVTGDTVHVDIVYLEVRKRLRTCCLTNFSTSPARPCPQTKLIVKRFWSYVYIQIYSFHLLRKSEYVFIY